METHRKDLYDLPSILEVYDSLEEKKWVEKLLDNVKKYVFYNNLNENNILEFKDFARKITGAYYNMKYKFSEIFRDEWTRYFEHLRAVANIVLELENPTVEKVLIALFHDAIEDVDANFEAISYMSGDPKIALAVEAISKKPWEEYSDDKAEWKTLRNKNYFGHLKSYESMKIYVTELALEKWLKLTGYEIKAVTQNIFDVKFADRIHNLSTQWDENNTDKVKRKVEETKKYFLDIALKVNPEAYNKLNTLILKLEIQLAWFAKKTEKILDK